MTTMTLDTMFDSTFDTTFDTTFESTFDTARLSRPRPTVRLTRRGRVVVVVAALLVAFAVGVFVTAAGSVASQHPGTPAPTKIVQVSSGDTLWGLASELADDGDVTAMMEQIKQLNALDSSALQAGQRLVVPAE